MILIIAEKPSVMKNIIDAKLEAQKPKSFKGYQLGQNFIYTHCIGHLLTLKMPGDIDPKYKQWSLEALPFDFDEIPLEVNASVSDQYKIVENLVKRDDIEEIVNACDSDREGDLIFRNLYHYIGKRIPRVSRMWLESQTPEGIKEAFDKRLSESVYNNVYFAGKSRSYADYIIGLNSTRAMTSKLGGNKNVLTIGRVQTPTLRIICDLEDEIRNFKEEPYYKVKAIGRVNDAEISAYYTNEDLENNRFKEKNKAEALISSLAGKNAIVSSADTTKRNEKPKMLYSLSDLQIDMDKRYKMSAMDVLNTAQSLYETHKLITYPRTDENHISKELASKTYQILNGISVNPEVKKLIIDNKYGFNPMMIAKKDIGAHEALTPTITKADESRISKLSEMEMRVYMAIVERFMAAFLPDAILEKQKIAFNIDDASFETEIEICTRLGHREAYKYGRKSSETKSFIRVKKDDVVLIDELKLEEGKTTPPARFSEGSLIKMMKNPSKYVDDKSDKDVLKKTEGIGTEATRAQIIADLKKHEFIDLDKKKQIIATKKGMDLIKEIPGDELKSVKLTADFERKLDLISRGEYDHKDFLNEIRELENHFISSVKNLDTSSSSLSGIVAKCPICGSSIVERDKVYSCQNRDCNVYIFKTAFGAKLITKSQAKSLFEDGRTKTKVLCSSKKTGHDFEAVMTYKYDNSQENPNVLGFDFNDNAPSEEETEALREKLKAFCKCPNCGSDIYEDNFKYYCSNKSCRVMLFKKQNNIKKFTKTLAKELLVSGKSKDMVDISVNNADSKAYIKYEYDETKKYPNQILFVYNK